MPLQWTLRWSGSYCCWTCSPWRRQCASAHACPLRHASVFGHAATHWCVSGSECRRRTWCWSWRSSVTEVWSWWHWTLEKEEREDCTVEYIVYIQSIIPMWGYNSPLIYRKWYLTVVCFWRNYFHSWSLRCNSSNLEFINSDSQYPIPWMKYLKASITLAGCGEKDEKH